MKTPASLLGASAALLTLASPLTAGDPVETAPTAPGSLSAAPSLATEIHLFWSARSGDETGFTIERSESTATGFKEIGATPAGATTYDDQTVVPEKTYFYRVRAFNSAGQSVPSAEAQVTTLDQLATVHPAGVVIAAGDAAITPPFVLNEADGALSQPMETNDDLTGGGRAVFTVDVSVAGDYAVLAVVDAPDTESNSFFVNVDAEPNVPASAWHIPVTAGFERRFCSWQGAGSFDMPAFRPKLFPLSEGPHEIVFRGRESGTRLRQVRLVKPPLAPSRPRIVAEP